MKFVVLLCGFVLGQPQPKVEIDFLQVAPQQRDSKTLQRSLDQQRAVVLIHGLKLHPFSSDNVNKPVMSGWQKPKSNLVATLAKEADVFALAYSQNAALETIAALPEVVRPLRRLRELGYRDIVLIGHSSGGVLARHLVEDHPHLGVTHVLQVGSPNAGSALARATWSVRKNQEAFLESITHQGREQTLARRGDRRIPEQIAFVCVVCRIPVSGNASVQAGKSEVEVALKRGDGVVSCVCQWSADVQAQGIPAVVLDHSHFTAMFSKATAERLVQLIREPPPRWSPEQVEAARVRILGPMKLP